MGSPGSLVTDHCAIDLDQKEIEEQVAKGTNDSFENAMKIYKNGGNSKSYAQITLTPALTRDLSKGTSIMGKNADGVEVAGMSYSQYSSGDKVIKVQYTTNSIQSSYVGCQVGALVSGVNTEGCFAETGIMNIDGTDYNYVYSVSDDNRNGRTIAGFSENAKDKMRVGCKGCPYEDFLYFHDYYGTDTYADEWIKKGTAYMNVFMYVIREFEDALDDCEKSCILCNDDAVHAWDEGVCFYTGSIEGQDGLTSGKLLHQLADKRCQNYKTCGPEGGELEGTSALNYELFDLFALGNYQLQSGNCPAARQTTKLITELMYIPLIQGTMRYAYKVDKLSGMEKEAAEGAVFAAAVLPRIHAASESAAATIYDNMKVGATSTSYSDVKNAFESVYPDLGISCKDIGGLWNSALNDYYEGMAPCKDASTLQKEEDKTLAIVLGSVFGGLFFLTILYVLFLRKREIEGKPVFEAAVAPNKEMS